MKFIRFFKVLLIIVFASVTNAQAGGLSVFSPLVEEGEIGIELRYVDVIKAEPAEEGASSMALAVEWGINDKWRLEFVTEYETPAAGSTEHEAYEIEFVRNLTEQGEDGVNYSSAVVFAVGIASEETAADAIELGYYFEKGLGEKEGKGEGASYPSSFTLNIKLEDQQGSNAESGIEVGYGMQFKTELSGEMQIGVEMFGEISEEASSFNNQEHLIGPVLFGEIELGEESELGYQIGYLFGLSDAAADGVLKLNLAYEF